MGGDGRYHLQICLDSALIWRQFPLERRGIVARFVEVLWINGRVFLMVLGVSFECGIGGR